MKRTSIALLLVLCSPLVARSQLGSPITAETNLLPDNKIQLTIRNNAQVALTAWLVTVIYYSIEDPSSPTHATETLFYDAVSPFQQDRPDSGWTFVFDTPLPLQPLPPSGSWSFTYTYGGGPEAVAPKVTLVAAVFSDGTVFGDPRNVDRIVARRRFTLHQIEEAVGVLTEASSSGTPVAQIILRFQALQKEHKSMYPQPHTDQVADLMWCSNLMDRCILGRLSPPATRGQQTSDLTGLAGTQIVAWLIDQLNERRNHLVNSLPDLRNR